MFVYAEFVLISEYIHTEPLVCKYMQMRSREKKNPYHQRRFSNPNIHIFHSVFPPAIYIFTSPCGDGVKHVSLH